MTLLVGIDEAGYGPLLGPLAVSSAVFELPSRYLGGDLWKILYKAVSKQKKSLSGRLLITDSKIAYTRSGGIGNLRKTVLSSLLLCNGSGLNFSSAYDLISFLAPDTISRLSEYPWYEQIRFQHLDHDPNDIEIASGVLSKTLTENNMKLCGISSRCLDVHRYNTLVGQVKNKSRVLFTELCSLILDAFNTFSNTIDPLQIIVDRQGGRMKYEKELMRMFPGFSLSILRQDESVSSYELTTGSRSMKIHFCIKADSKYLPVCLASMVSKYLREVMMESINNYFRNICPALKPTAGYWQDGQRFIKNLSELMPDYKYNPEKLIRIC